MFATDPSRRFTILNVIEMSKIDIPFATTGAIVYEGETIVVLELSSWLVSLVLPRHEPRRLPTATLFHTLHAPTSMQSLEPDLYPRIINPNSRRSWLY